MEVAFEVPLRIVLPVLGKALLFVEVWEEEDFHVADLNLSRITKEESSPFVANLSIAYVNSGGDEIFLSSSFPTGKNNDT